MVSVLHGGLFVPSLLQLSGGGEFHIQKLCLQILGLGWLGNKHQGMCGSEAAVWLPVLAVNSSGAGGVKNVPAGQVYHCFSWPSFLHSQAACLQSVFYSCMQRYQELHLTCELPFSSFQHRSPLTMCEGPVPPACWWTEFCQEPFVFSEGYINTN